VDVTKQLRLLPSPDVMLFVQGRPATLSAEQLIAEIEWPDTAEAQDKDSDEGLSVAETAGFPHNSTTCELLRHAEPPPLVEPGHAPMPRTDADLARLIYATLSIPFTATFRRRSIFRDEQSFPQQRLQDFLHWVAGLRVLPEGGLASTEMGKITLKCRWPPVDAQERKLLRWTDKDVEFKWPSPESSTCNVEVTLPNFSKRDVLAKKLLTAIEETRFYLK
tara:strand:- start:125 stop:784 length:660 start_codon:yes stop_codon:yes gene_type:complete